VRAALTPGMQIVAGRNTASGHLREAKPTKRPHGIRRDLTRLGDGISHGPGRDLSMGSDENR